MSKNGCLHEFNPHGPNPFFCIYCGVSEQMLAAGIISGRIESDLDLDDVTGGHPVALKELAELRSENAKLKSAMPDPDFLKLLSLLSDHDGIRNELSTMGNKIREAKP